MFGYGTPTMKTARHMPSGKSMPSLTFPRQMMQSMAPLGESAFFLKSFMLMSMLFSSKMTYFAAERCPLLGERMSSYLKSVCILNDGKTRRMPLGIRCADSTKKSIKSL